MLTLIGSLLGFATSAIPDIMSMFRERADRKHELAMLDRQMEQMRLGHTQRLDEIEAQALFAAVMSFWFGNRTLSKLRGRR